MPEPEEMFMEDVIEASALCNQASEGPWRVEHDIRNHGHVKLMVGCGPEPDQWKWAGWVKFRDQSDADFVAEARTLLPRALREIVRLRDKLEKSERQRGETLERLRDILEGLSCGSK